MRPLVKREKQQRRAAMNLLSVGKGMLKTVFATGVLLATPTLTLADSGTKGRNLYTMYCVQCHGINGDGQGVNAASMSVQPRSHIEKEEMEQRLDEELFKVIEQGGASINKSVLMPAWKDNLSAEQINALVDYLRELCCAH